MTQQLLVPGKDDRFYFPTTEADHIIPLLPDNDFYDSNSFMCVGRDGSLLQLACFCATLYPMYTHQPGIFLRLVGADGKEIATFKEKFDKKDLQQNGPSFSVAGFSFNWSEEGFVFKFAQKGCPIQGELVARANQGGGVKYGEDGKIATTPERTHYAQFFYTLPRGLVRGKLTINGKREIDFDGWAFGSHYVSNIKAHHLAMRWQYLKFHSDEFTINLTMLVAPKTYKGQKIYHGNVVYKEKLFAVTVDNEIINHSGVADKDSGYEQPTDIEYILRGSTLEGEPFSVNVRITPTNLYNKFDILGELPWAIRMIIKAFLARPFHYQWLDKATAQITIGDKKLEVTGLALHEVTFVNPE